MLTFRIASAKTQKNSTSFTTVYSEQIKSAWHDDKEAGRARPRKRHEPKDE